MENKESIVTAQMFSGYILEDDNSETGGKAFIDETLEEFMESVNKPMDTPMDEVNVMLIYGGIEPIIY